MEGAVIGVHWGVHLQQKGHHRAGERAGQLLTGGQVERVQPCLRAGQRGGWAESPGWGGTMPACRRMVSNVVDPDVGSSPACPPLCWETGGAAGQRGAGAPPHTPASPAQDGGAADRRPCTANANRAAAAAAACAQCITTLAAHLQLVLMLRFGFWVVLVRRHRRPAAGALAVVRYAQTCTCQERGKVRLPALGQGNAPTVDSTRVTVCPADPAPP